ncbi:translocation/assembly module TamB [Dysgonomonas sp. 216]|uniref:translocation/assembly module TamB domain-containing protein n=1 Tax=Dysgonomonas sp. 216 TaxID=2302934 RepID=UPI0013D3B77E|nr:translocation/assembly module TamB domain-containing protein [Dysgonomonas sp. 216]NDW18939.1 translocation/assembly module TamB [Dysgonomonas sp. 216]
MSSVQERIKEVVVTELKAKLNTELNIEKLHFQPFNTIELNGVELYDRENEQILKAKKLYAKVALLPLLRNKITINAVKLNFFDVYLSKETSSSPLNIQFVIDAFKSDNTEKKTKFDVKINSVSLADGSFNFDIHSKPFKKDGIFDANHIHATDINARLSLKSLQPDSLNIQIKQLSLKEKSGIEIKNLIVRLVTQGKDLSVKNFQLELPKSNLQFDKCEVKLHESQTPQELINNMEFVCDIQSSYITPKDISAFVPALSYFYDRIYFKTKASGKIRDFTVSELSLDYGDKMQLRANAQILNLRDVSELYLKGSVDELYITPEGISGIATNLNVNVPDQILNLGKISFHGDISGYLEKLKAKGLLKTELGHIQTDLLFGFGNGNGIKSYFKGNVSTKEFELGNLIANNDLGVLSFNLSVDLKQPQNKQIGGLVKGTIEKFEYKNYQYNNIILNGTYNNRKAEGELLIDDENVYLDMSGIFDLSKKQPELNFVSRLKNLRLDKLHLSDKYINSYLSLNIDANFAGSNIDNAIGYLSIDSVRFYRNEKNIHIDKLLIEASGLSSDKHLKISSDILNGEVIGKYSFTTMGRSIMHTLQPYLPALITHTHNAKKETENNALSLKLSVANTENISDIFSLPFTVSEKTEITGSYNNITDKIELNIDYPAGKIAGAKLKSSKLHISNIGDSIIANISTVVTAKNNVQNNVLLNLSASNNTIKSKISFTNNSRNKFYGDILASAKFTKEDKNDPLQTDIEIFPSNMVLNDTLWQIDPALIHINSKYISVNNFNIHDHINSQSVNINGQYSKYNPQDILYANLKNINLEYVFNTLAIDALNFGGKATGTLYASSIEENPYANIKLDVSGFMFNNAPLGNLNLYSELDEATKKILLKGNLINEDNKNTLIDGYINPINQELSINFDAKDVNVGFLNKYVSSLFNNVKGKGSGKVKLYGNFKNVTVEGKAFIENGSLGINFLNTYYTFTDTIFMKKDLIYFNNIKFSDPLNNTANISGKVVHDFFANFMYYVDMQGSNFMLYNASSRHNPMFYGKVFASGSGSISGDEQEVNIDAQLKTDANTKIIMNFMEETIDSYSFITYKTEDIKQEPSAEKKKERTNTENVIKTESGIGINISLYIDATPDATVELVMDPVGGDMLRSSGSGAMQFVWGTKTSPQLFGNYTINQGSYNFTFQKIIEKKFNIRSGSSVLFRGDPFQANLNIDAIYHLNANLSDLDQNLAVNSGQYTVPVECILNITGELRHPNIAFDVVLPSVNPEVQRQVKSLMNDPDMINRQMVYLLLLSKFYTPNYANIENKTNDFASLASATLSTQLSKILSMIDDRWQVGTNIRTSDSEFTSTEVELLLSSQLLNNRVLLNGNFGYKDNPQTQAAFIGDVDIEVLLNKIGTWRLKAYNRYNEKYYLIGNGGSEGTSAIQTQGIGIMYKKDFDGLKDLFGIRSKPRLTYPTLQRDTIQPLLPDSTTKGSSLGAFIRIKE